MNAIQNLQNLEARKYTLFRIRDGKGFYISNGEEITTKEFEKMFPIPLVVKNIDPKTKGRNCDHTKDFLFDD